MYSYIKFEGEDILFLDQFIYMNYLNESIHS